MRLSDEEIDKRVLDAPSLCPFCRSENVETAGTDGSDREVWLTVTCGDCDEEWVELYKLVGATNTSLGRRHD